MSCCLFTLPLPCVPLPGVVPDPVLYVRSQANFDVVRSGSRVLAGGIGDGTAVSLVPSSPPLSPLPPSPIFRPVLHAQESRVVTVGYGAGRRGCKTR